MVIDVAARTTLRIISVYRTFSPQDGVTPREKFKEQINLIQAAVTNNCTILGDFNLDWNRKFDTSYIFRNYFDDLEEC